MAYDLKIFEDGGFDAGYVEWLTQDQWPQHQEHFGRLWDYYQNPTMPVLSSFGDDIGGGYIQAQEAGLPTRITGRCYRSTRQIPLGRKSADMQRKEVVIENDIAWRIGAMVDFLFGKGVSFVSRVAEGSRRRDIEQILKAVFEANGGAGFFQDMAVLGGVYGFADCLVRPGAGLFARLCRPRRHDVRSALPAASTFASVLEHASTIALELIEAPRALPVLDEADYRRIRYYVQHFLQPCNAVETGTAGIVSVIGHRASSRQRRIVTVTEILGPGAWQRYENGMLAEEGENPLGFVPVVHIQNLAQPYYYEGVSDVEQLVPLQDELNTRLSDRASRITMQAFKMYLAKGLDGFSDKPISPGRMWFTDNPEASLEAFGGDGGSPSENLHIAEVREAMDKISGVTPVVAGVLKNKLGNLTSGVALKMTFMGMLTKTARKQLTYGQGLRAAARMILTILDQAGVYPTTSDERQVDVVFANPLPEDETERLKEALMKKELGVADATLRQELGYMDQ
jgi:hypothetical protein